MPPTAHFTASVAPNTSGHAALLEFESRVRKLSNVGISLSLSRDADAALKPYEGIFVSLRLPGGSTTYHIACLVRHRSVAEDDHVLYSCEYDWSGTSDALGVVEDLLEYTLETH